ncbi:hypothetical protein D3C71_1075880 [compost metagenome]
MADRGRQDAGETLGCGLAGHIAGHQRALAQFLQEAHRCFHLGQIGAHRIRSAIQPCYIGDQGDVLALAVVFDIRAEAGVDAAVVVEDRRDQAVGVHAVLAVPGQVVARDLGFAHAQQHRRGGHAVADEGAVVIAWTRLHGRPGLVDQHVGGLRAQHVHQRGVGQAQPDLAQPRLPVGRCLAGQGFEGSIGIDGRIGQVQWRGLGQCAIGTGRSGAEREGDHDRAALPGRQLHAIAQRGGGQPGGIAGLACTGQGAGGNGCGDLGAAVGAERRRPGRIHRAQ